MTTTTKLVAFHGDPKVKAKYLQRVRAHAAADEIVQGRYWEKGKGCAVGCTIHGDKHFAYEDKLGIPFQLAFFQDSIFEGLALEQAKLWPEQFLAAIQVGADLNGVAPAFMACLLADPKEGLIAISEADDGKQALAAVAACYERRSKGAEPTEAEW